MAPHRRWIASWLTLGITAVIALGGRAPTAWTGVAFIATWLLFVLVGNAWLPRSVEPSEQPEAWVEPLHYIVVSAAAGFCCAIVLWSLSALITKSVLPGSVATLAFAAFGARRFWRLLPRVTAGFSATVPFCLTGVAFALGIYIYGINEVRDGSNFLFTYRWDVAPHMYWAGLVRDLGLPIVEHNGAATVPYMPLYHTGVLVAAAGLEPLASSFYQAARILGIGSMMLIALTSATVAARFGLTTSRSILVGVAPLVWAGLSLPLDLLRGNLAGIVDPYLASVAPLSAAAGSFYHNLPQVTAIAVGGTAVVQLERYEAAGRRRDLVLCGALLGMSLLLKPTVFILFVPAVLIVLALARERVPTLIAFVGAAGVGAFVFALPTLVADLPSAPPWTLQPENLLKLRTVIVTAVLGLAIPIAFWRALEWYRDRSLYHWQTLDVVLLALLGGVLFAALFVEPGERGSTGNQFWPRNAALVLAAPYITSVTLRFARQLNQERTSWRRAVATAALVILGLHLAGGSIYAARYPGIHVNRVSAANIKTLEAITAATPDTARLLADLTSAEAPYLPRRFVFGASWTHLLARDLELWRELRKGAWNDTLMAFLSTRSGVVVGPNTRHLEPRLASLGWTKEIRGAAHDYWRPPIQSPAKESHP